MNYTHLYSEKDEFYFSHSRTELLKYVPKNVKKVLDVGCANGNFGALLKKVMNCEVWGVEPNANSAKEAIFKLDHVYEGLFDQQAVNILNTRFDCIFFNDVLEHLLLPEEALMYAKSLLNKDGMIIASIPNIRYYPVILSLIRYKDFQYQDAGVLDKTHLKFFTQKSMIRFFENCGLRVEQIEGINGSKFKYLRILNFLSFGKFKDMKYPQFVVVAKSNR
jgi:2-polyprenyl-3-methyl-5-hydroxy-6-metoxy-1,4-benzoquinol methylase